PLRFVISLEEIRRILSMHLIGGLLGRMPGKRVESVNIRHNPAQLPISGNRGRAVHDPEFHVIPAINIRIASEFADHAKDVCLAEKISGDSAEVVCFTRRRHFAFPLPPRPVGGESGNPRSESSPGGPFSCVDLSSLSLHTSDLQLRPTSGPDPDR